MEQTHLTDELFVEYSRYQQGLPDAPAIGEHLAACADCAAEVVRIRRLGAIWQDETAVQALMRRARAALGLDIRPPLVETVAAAAGRLLAPFAVSLRPLIRPQGAYGETLQQEHTMSTLEFSVTQDGRIVDGLRGILKRVNREYYVRIFAVDPASRTLYGDCKAMISIFDSYLDRPILHRKIDVGVTVLLGTDFRLTDDSCLAVEMLPPYV
ncbi:MAG: hypothetical protein ACLQVD_19805 [Capsulimonadaceae bacterium]